MKAVRPVIGSNGVSYIQMRSVGSHSTSGKERERDGEGKKEERDWDNGQELRIYPTEWISAV